MGCDWKSPESLRWPRDVDSAFEIGAVLDDDARGLDVADEIGALAEDDARGGVHIAADGSGDVHLRGLDIGCGLTLGADRQAVVQFHAAFHFPVQLQLTGAKNIALDAHCFSDQTADGRVLIRHAGNYSTRGADAL